MAYFYFYTEKMLILTKIFICNIPRYPVCDHTGYPVIVLPDDPVYGQNNISGQTLNSFIL